MRAWRRLGAAGALFASLCAPGGLREAARAPDSRGTPPTCSSGPKPRPSTTSSSRSSSSVRAASTDALAAYQRAVAKDPDSAYLQRKVAESLVRQNQLADGIVVRTSGRTRSSPTTFRRASSWASSTGCGETPEAAEALLVDEHGEPLSTDAGFLLFEAKMDLDWRRRGVRSGSRSG